MRKLLILIFVFASQLGNGQGSQSFGTTGIGGTTILINADNKYACKFTTGSNVGTVIDFNAYLDRSGTGGGYAVSGGIYTDNSGAPDALVANSEIQISTNLTRNTAQWYTATYITAPTLSSSTTYWLVVHGAKNWVNTYDAGGSNQSALLADTYAGGLSDPFGTPTYTSRNISFYVTYNEAPAAKPRRVTIIN